MRDVHIALEAITPYSASRPIVQELRKGETLDQHERRRWREKAHVDENGVIFVPGVSFKMSIDEVAGLLNEKIRGKGNQTYTGLISTGIVAMNDVSLGIKIEDVRPVEIYAHANGRRGPGTRVTRLFPYVPSWRGELHLRVLNDNLPEDVVERYVEQAGLLAGVGRGRPITRSPAGNGRFKPTRFTWS